MNPRTAAPSSEGSDEALDQSPLGGRHAGVLVATLLLGVLAYQLNASMVTPALPDMARQIGDSLGDISQVSTLFFLAGAIAGVVFSRFSDFTGRRRMLLSVLAVTILGTVLSALAPNLPVLLTGRVLQGASSAAFQLAYIVLNERISRRLFGAALGVITAVNGGVGGVDGYLGGVLSDSFGFRAIFGVIAIVGISAAICVARNIPKDSTVAPTGQMDWLGSAVLAAALICVTYAVSRGSSVGWLSGGTLWLIAGTVLSLALFAVIEKKQRVPLIAVSHLRSRQGWPVILTTVLVLSGVFAVINFTVVVISQSKTLGYGLSASDSALLYLTPAALIGVFAAPLSGWLAGRAGWIKLLRTGLALCVCALAVVALYPLSQWTVFAAIAALGVFYNGLALTTLNGLSVLLSPKEAPAALPGLSGAAFGIGASLGISIVAPFTARATHQGYITALWISASITLLALITSLFVAPRKGEPI